MSSVTSTNIRVGPGFYLAIKHLSETSGLSMGYWTNLLLAGVLMSNQEMLAQFPQDIQKAITADSLSVLGDLIKIIGFQMVQNTSISNLYNVLLRKNQNDDSK